MSSFYEVMEDSDEVFVAAHEEEDEPPLGQSVPHHSDPYQCDSPCDLKEDDRQPETGMSIASVMIGAVIAYGLIKFLS